MAASNPNLPWYQFSLRSLLLLTAFVAVLCSLGKCTDWLVSAAVGTTAMIGGIVGLSVDGTRFGFVEGALWALVFSEIAGGVFLLLGRLQLVQGDLAVYAILTIGVPTVGFLGGLKAGGKIGRNPYDQDHDDPPAVE